TELSLQPTSNSVTISQLPIQLLFDSFPMGAYLLYLILQGALAFEYAGDDPGACFLLSSYVGGMVSAFCFQLARHAPALCLPADEESGDQQTACYPCAGAKGHHRLQSRR